MTTTTETRSHNIESQAVRRRRIWLEIVESWSDQQAQEQVWVAIDFFTDAYKLAYPDCLLCTCREMATDYVSVRVMEILKG
jgi:hypothetical protein